MNKMLERGLGIFLLVAVITGITLYYTVDANTLAYMSEFNAVSIVLALVCLTIGMYFDGLRLQRHLRLLGYKLPIHATLRVIFGNYFMALLTPGASGGAVAQVLLLKGYGVPIFEATPVVFIRTIFSILFLCAMLPFIFLYYPVQIGYVSNEFFLYASILLVICVVGVVALFRTRTMKVLAYFLATRISYFSVKRVLKSVKELNHGFSLLYKDPKQTGIVFIESGLSLLFLYGIAPALMLAFVHQVDILDVMSRMIMLNLVLYF